MATAKRAFAVTSARPTAATARSDPRGTRSVAPRDNASARSSESDATRAPLRDPKTLDETDGAVDGYKAILSKLRDLTIDFEKPVVLVHGDSHYFRIDKPFQDSKGRRLENFTRVETFGDNQGNGNNDVQWVKALIDPQSRDVFAFQPQIVPANRVAVPAP